MQKKIDQAKALNIPVISEQQWFELMPELEALECGTESQFRLQMIMEFTILMWAVMVDGPKKNIAAGLDAVIYARYSSHNQREVSIEQQIAECTKHAAALDCALSVHTRTGQSAARRITGLVSSR